MFLMANLKFKTSFLLCTICTIFLVGCAGGHHDTLAGEGAREVEIDGVIYVVSKTSKDIYSVTHKDWLKHNFVLAPSEFIKRKVVFTAAIEKYSGCKVAVSDFGAGHDSLSASVICN